MYSYLSENLRGKEHNSITFFGSNISSGNLLSEIDSLASFLKLSRIEQGESIAICLPNIPEAIIAFYAVNKTGAVANMIHPLIGSDGLYNILKRTRSTYLFIMDSFYLKHKEVLKKLPLTVVICSPKNYLSGLLKTLYKIKNRKVDKAIKKKDVLFFKDLIGVNYDFDPVPSKDGIAVYLHSGGTTGEPKTVMLSNFALNALADSLKEWFITKKPFSSDDAILMVLPLFHGFGLGVCMHTILPRFRIVLMPSFNAKSAIKIIKKEKITFLAGVPAMFQKLLKEKSFMGPHLKSLRFIFSGGDKLPDNLKIEFDKAIKDSGGQSEILEGYGLTETVTVCTINPLDAPKLSSIGKPIPKTELIIYDGKNICAPNVPGEILVSGDTLMSGYLNDKVTTDQCFMSVNGKRYVKTGDCGYLDEEGYLFFKDRYKRMVKIAGIGIFPAEIEASVLKMNEIARALVIPAGDEKTYLKLYIELKKDIVYSVELEKKIKNQISSDLIKYAVPREIIVKKELPLTKVGKVDISALEK